MGRSADAGRVAFWRKIIQGRRLSGLSVAQCCAEADVSTASFYSWQRKLRRGVPAARQAAADRGNTARLIPVRILPDAPAGRLPGASAGSIPHASAGHSHSAGMLEVELPGEIRLRIPPGCDASTLQVVMSLLLPGGGRERGSC